MKLASCDFCDPKGEKPRGDCLTTNIDGRAYDICAECKTTRDELLEGKGAAVYMGTVSLPSVWYDWHDNRTGTITFNSYSPPNDGVGRIYGN